MENVEISWSCGTYYPKSRCPRKPYLRYDSNSHLLVLLVASQIVCFWTLAKNLAFNNSVFLRSNFIFNAFKLSGSISLAHKPWTVLAYEGWVKFFASGHILVWEVRSTMIVTFYLGCYLLPCWWPVRCLLCLDLALYQIPKEVRQQVYETFFSSLGDSETKKYACTFFF